MDTERPATPECPYPSPYHRAMWAPLVRVSEALASSTRIDDSFFDIDDFMHMSWCREDRPEGLMLYKHIDTRHYLNLDTLGTAYAYFPPRTNDPSDHGTYRPHATLRDGIDRLGLWELPWMRTELEAHRHGLEWQDRFEVWEYLTSDGLDRAS